MASLSDRIKESTTLTLGAVTILGQAVVFAYMGGRLAHFGIPIHYLTFRPNLLFVSIAILLIVAYFGGLCIVALNLVVRHLPEPLRYGLVLFGAIWAACVLLVLALPPQMPKWVPWFWLIPAALTTLTYFAWPIIVHKRYGYLESIAYVNGHLRRQVDPDGDGLLSRMLGSLGPELLIAAALLLVAWELGIASARTTVEYTVASLPGRPEMVVLYGDDSKFILAPFDRATQVVSRTHYIVTLEQNPELSDVPLTQESVGPLALPDAHPRMPELEIIIEILRHRFDPNPTMTPVGTRVPR